jgi:hypothetical protein
MRYRTLAILLAILVSLGLAVATSAPAAAHHSPGAKIGNHQTSENYIEVATSCSNGVLGYNKITLWWGESSATYDKCFKVPYGWLYDAHRNGSRIYNNKISKGEAISIGSDSWVITVVQYGPY